MSGSEVMPWGRLSTGEPLELQVLRSPSGMTATLSPFGAALVSLEVPDRNGRPGEVVLGLETPSDYESNPNYLGVTVGRFAGRVANGRFDLDGREIRLPDNFFGHHLHGGPVGFGHRLWGTERVTEGGVPGVRFRLTSAAGDQGWPGTVDASVIYLLDDAGALAIRYRAETDAPTHLNLTNHAYFNLAGSGEVGGHVLRIAADRYLELGEAGIPTGRLLPVEGTPFDFTREKPLLRDAPHYDHCFAVSDWDGSLRECARLEDPESGRVMTVCTTAPGVQLYTPDFRDPLPGRGGAEYRGRAALCLETQFFPDTANHPSFPSTRLDPGEVWEHETVLSFSAE